jgi:two-component system chemotaxis response regulator CheB
VSKIRVLIIDDAVVIRRIVSDVLSGDPDIEVVGTAANGKIGLSKIPQVNPDLVTLDMEMPEMDGIATLRELRKTHRKLPVIMFSTLTSRGVSATLEALSCGANDYVTKPANVGSVAIAMTRIRDELIPKIKALCRAAEAAGCGSVDEEARAVHRRDRGGRDRHLDGRPERACGSHSIAAWRSAGADLHRAAHAAVVYEGVG